ncbi:MAG: hypothetical protein Q7S98_06510 [Deltaproteobacteria bacterium]|nr:hypothetical protein [Deltaproteobacteria bacterium]
MAETPKPVGDELGQLYLEAFRRLDTDQDARISLEEYTPEGDPSSHVGFDRFDKDRDGFIELAEYLQSQNQGRPSPLFESDIIARLKQSYLPRQDPPAPHEADVPVKNRSKTPFDSAAEALRASGRSPEKAAEILKRMVKGSMSSETESSAPRVSGLYKAVPNLVKAGFSDDQIAQVPGRLSRESHRSPGEFIQNMASAAAKLRKLGLTPDQIIEIVSAVATESKAFMIFSYTWLAETAETVQRQIADTGELTSFLIRLTKQVGKSYPETQLLLIAGARVSPPNGGKNFQKGFELTLRFLPPIDFQALQDIITYDGVTFDFSQIHDRQTLADEMARVFNSYFASDHPREEEIGFARRAAVLINHLHDEDHRQGNWDDLIRQRLVAGLTPKACYRIASLAGPDLYTTTFLQAFYPRFASDPKLAETLRTVDPKGDVLGDFILTLASFKKFWELFQREPAFFTSSLIHLIQAEDKDQLVKNLAFLTDSLGSILQNSAAVDLRRQIEEAMISGFLRSVAIEKKAAYGFVIKKFERFFTDPRVPEITDSLPTILPPTVPTGWLQDGVVRAKLFFYPDEPEHFRLIQEMYRDLGFQVTKQGSKSVTMTQTLANGRRLEVIATLEEANMEKEMKDPRTDIIGHRGHSFHLEETFGLTCEGCSDQQKLLYLGSCGSFRSVPELSENYGGNYFISDEDTGHGSDNNLTLYYLMSAIGSGIKDWEGIQEYIGQRHNLNESGIVFPTAPSMQLIDYTRKMKKQ